MVATLLLISSAPHLDDIAHNPQPQAMAIDLLIQARATAEHLVTLGCRNAISQQRLNRELNRARLAGETLPGALFDCEKELPGLSPGDT